MDPNLLTHFSSELLSWKFPGVDQAQSLIEGITAQLMEWDSEHAIDSGRQLQQINNIAAFLGSFLPNITLDSPTIMSLLILVAFVVQFYWTVVSVTLAQSSTSDSSSSNSATTTTTIATRIVNAVEAAPNIQVRTTTKPTTIVPRTQTVTPAPAPSYRFYKEVPYHWLEKRSVPQKPSNPTYNMESSHVPYYEYFNTFNDQKPSGYFSSKEIDPPSILEDSYSDKRPKLPLNYEAVGHNIGNIKPIDLVKKKKFQLISPNRISRVAWGGAEVPLTLASHRLSEMKEMEDDLSIGGLIYTAEKWGQKLRDWHILPKDGAQTMAQTLMIIRCAIAKDPDVCGHLDHYYRRQQDLKLAAAIMNHQNTVANDLNIKQNSHSKKKQNIKKQKPNTKNKGIFKGFNETMFYDNKKPMRSRTVSKPNRNINSMENRRGVSYSTNPYDNYDDYNDDDPEFKTIEKISRYDSYEQNRPSIYDYTESTNRIPSQNDIADSSENAIDRNGFLTFESFTVGPPYNFYLFLTLGVVLFFLIDASARLLSLVFDAARSTPLLSDNENLINNAVNILSNLELLDFLNSIEGFSGPSVQRNRGKRKRKTYIR